MKRHQLLVTICTFLFFCFCKLPSIEAQIDPNSKKFIATIDSIFSDKSDMTSPGAVVIIMKGKNTILSKSYGSANLSFGLPFNENTLFPLSNFTEQLVAFSVLQLEEKGLIKLSDPINKYLPVLGFQKEVFITHLLNHSSDLPLVASLRLMAGWNFPDPFYQEDFLSLTKKITKNLKPDIKIQHSHAGIKILQMLVEKVSGKDFPKYASTNIFQPLGMTSTVIKNEHFKENKNHSIGYDKTDDGYQRSYITELASMCPMTYSTQNDFEKWMLNMQTKKIGGSIIEKLDQALSIKGVSEKRKNRTYCIGQQQYYKAYGEDEFYFRDTDEGHSWKWIRLKQSEISIMAIGNLNSYIGTKVNTIESLLVTPPSPTKSPVIEKSESTPIQLSEKEMQAYTGFFWDSGYLFTSHVTIKDGGLYYTDLDNGWHFPMTLRSKSRFDSPDGTQMEFSNLDEDPKFTLTTPNGSKYYSNKYDAANLEKIDRSKYAGIYSSDALNVLYEMIVEDNKLLLKRSRKPDLELVPIGKNKFRTKEMDFRLIAFKENEKQAIYQMDMSNLSLKNIAFRKR